jgi:hypothetical protein
MSAAAANFPVLIRERADPSSLAQYADVSQLIMVVEEFADIISEFEAWDATCRAIELERTGSELMRGIQKPKLYVKADPEEGAVWSAIRQYCTSLGRAFEPGDAETPCRFFSRISAEKK